jgi:hypothetical protein
VKTDLPARHDSRPPAQQEQRALILEVDAEPKPRAYHVSVESGWQLSGHAKPFYELLRAEVG